MSSDSPITVVVDINGGEEHAAVEACALASLDLENVELVVVGDEERVTQSLRPLAHNAEKLRVAPSLGICDPSLNTREALDKTPRSSITVGLELCAENPAAAFVSAGHPGAVVREAMRHLRRVEGVRRAALAAVYPTMRHRGEKRDPFALLLDVGATVQCRGLDLALFAVMGAGYARRISVNDRPKVAILSNGRRLESTRAEVAEAHQLLQKLEAELEYIGTLRADQLTDGEADVVVTDGFTGDIVIRTLQGVAETAEALLERAAKRFRWRMGVSMLGGGIARLRELTEWENYGGAPLLGFRQPIILTQSNSDQRAFFNAIRLAVKVHRSGVLDDVAESVANLRRQNVLDKSSG